MAATLLAWILASFVCWTCGFGFLQQFHPAPQKPLPHFSFICLTGFAVVMAVASFLSLVTKISEAILLILLALCISYHLARKTGGILLQNFMQAFRLPLPFLVLFSIGALLVLVMSVWHVIHPDTVEYHAAIINSIKEHGLVKGYAHENIRYGLQSNWFVGCALFSYVFFPITTLTYANSFVLFWLLLFLAEKLSEFYRKSLFFYALFLLLAWSLAFLDFTQIRLTSVSASPDFIATVYVLLALYFFITAPRLKEIYFSLLLFGATALVIKFSTFPVALLLLYLLAVAKNKKTFVTASLVLLMIIAPLVLRNLYTSGYFLFPAMVFSFATPPWKVDSAVVQHINHYITAYARTASPFDADAVQKTLALPPRQWLPVWWSMRNAGQKILVSCTLAALFAGLFTIKKLFSLFNQRLVVCLMISLTGLVCWMVLAPDPRFADAWLFCLMALFLPGFFAGRLEHIMNKRVIVLASYLLSFCLFLYLAYRIIYFFDAGNLLLPYGLQ